MGGLFWHLQIRLFTMLCSSVNTLKQERSTAKTYEHTRLDKTYVVDRHRCHRAAKFEVFVDEDHSRLLSLYWLHKLQKRLYKSRVLLLILVHAQLLICLFF